MVEGDSLVLTYPVHPDTNTNSPSTTALEYPISASNALPELMSCRAECGEDIARSGWEAEVRWRGWLDLEKGGCE